MQRGVPFLSIDSDRKLTLHPLQPFAKNNAPASAAEEGLLQEVVKSDQACAMEKWVHFGCEVRWQPTHHTRPHLSRKQNKIKLR
jgi:hypothetical protein